MSIAFSMEGYGEQGPTTYGSLGSGAGPFNAPRGMAVDLDGHLVVADTDNRRVFAVRGALLGVKKTWLPVVVRSGGAE